MNIGFYKNQRPQLVDPFIIKKYRSRIQPIPQLPNPVIEYIKNECLYILEHFKGVITIIILVLSFLYYRYKIMKNDIENTVKSTNEYTITYNDNNEYVNDELIDRNTQVISNNNKLVPPYMRDKIEKMINQDSKEKPNLRPTQLNHSSFYSPL